MLRQWSEHDRKQRILRFRHEHSQDAENVDFRCLFSQITTAAIGDRVWSAHILPVLPGNGSKRQNKDNCRLHYATVRGRLNIQATNIDTI